MLDPVICSVVIDAFERLVLSKTLQQIQERAERISALLRNYSTATFILAKFWYSTNLQDRRLWEASRSCMISEFQTAIGGIRTLILKREEMNSAKESLSWPWWSKGEPSLLERLYYLLHYASEQFAPFSSPKPSKVVQQKTREAMRNDLSSIRYALRRSTVGRRFLGRVRHIENHYAYCTTVIQVNNRLKRITTPPKENRHEADLLSKVKYNAMDLVSLLASRVVMSNLQTDITLKILRRLMYTIDTLASSCLFLEVAETFTIVQDGEIINSFLKVATPNNRLAVSQTRLFTRHYVPVTSESSATSADSDVEMYDADAAAIDEANDIGSLPPYVLTHATRAKQALIKARPRRSHPGCILRFKKAWCKRHQHYCTIPEEDVEECEIYNEEEEEEDAEDPFDV